MSGILLSKTAASMGDPNHTVFAMHISCLEVFYHRVISLDGRGVVTDSGVLDAVGKHATIEVYLFLAILFSE